MQRTAVVIATQGLMHAEWTSAVRPGLTYTGRSGTLSSWAASVLWIAIAGLPAPVGAVEHAFDSKGLSSIRWAKKEILRTGRAKPFTVILETKVPGGDGSRYQFENVAEASKSDSFDVGKKTLTQQYSWGVAEFQYRPGTDRLDVTVHLRNTSSRTIADFSINLLELSLPALPSNWKKGRANLANSLDNLAVVQADLSHGKLFVCNLSVDVPFVLGFDRPTDEAGLAYPLVIRGGVSTPSPGSYWVEPHGVPRIAPGKELTLAVTLRFAAKDAQGPKVFADAYQNFRDFSKFANTWKDRRPIGMIMHASGFKGHVSKTNPRGWLGNPKLDVTTLSGKADFRTAMLKAAERSVKAIKETGGQGMIFWDVEGQENPHPITYIGDPRLAKKLAPEMDEIADDYFKVYRDAGLRTGVCLRPSQVYYDEGKKTWAHGTGSDGGPGRGDFFLQLRPKDVPWYRFYPLAARMSERIAYAKKRWGCTLFYVDSNGVYRQSGPDQKFRWFLLDAAVWKKVKEDHPDILIVPEHQRDDQAFHVAGWAYTSNYMEVRMGGYGTPARVRDLLPGAFSVINVNDGDLDKHRAEIKANVALGDMLMFRGWFADKRNAWVKGVYDEVKRMPNHRDTETQRNPMR